MIVISADTGEPVVVDAPPERLLLTRGQAFLVPYNLRYTIDVPGTATLYKATVPGVF
jgi:hypothetical protein